MVAYSYLSTMGLQLTNILPNQYQYDQWLINSHDINSESLVIPCYPNTSMVSTYHYYIPTTMIMKHDIHIMNIY